MPRPTPAQFAYGSVTVILSTLAMLLLSGTPSGPGVAVIALAALVLGVAVALTAPGAASAGRARARTGGNAQTAAAAPADSTDSTDAQRTLPVASAGHARREASQTPAAAVRAPHSAARRVAEPSLRR